MKWILNLSNETRMFLHFLLGVAAKNKKMIGALNWSDGDLCIIKKGRS